MLAVSGLGLISGFFTSGSFTTGADVAEAGDGFCGGFWAWRRIVNTLVATSIIVLTAYAGRCIIHRAVPHHALHLPGAAGAVPNKPRVVHVFIRHLGLVTVLVVQVVTLLAFHQLVSHRHCHLSEEVKNTAGKMYEHEC